MVSRVLHCRECSLDLNEYAYNILEMDVNHNDLVCDSYSRRAASYDESNGGWHVTLGQDFVSWLDPRHGQTAIDLACGTGLVTLPLARKLGANGRVVAVDLTPRMLQLGQEKLSSLQSSESVREMAPVTWITADITSEELLSEPAIQEVLHDDGGFDIISICSALVLLPDQQQALQFWVEKLLKKGGRIIVDVPTEELTLHFLMTYHLPVAVGLSDKLSKGRLWIKNQQSLPIILKDIGLNVEQNICTESYLGTTWYNKDSETGLKVLEQQMAKNYLNISQHGKADEARKVWPEIWRKAARPCPDGDERVQDAHRLYVYVGRKL